MATPIRVTFVGDDAQLQAAAARSEAALARFAGSAKEAAAAAGKAAAEQAAAAGKSATEQEAAAARASAAVVEAAERTTAAQEAAARGAIAFEKAQGASADAQVAAARRAIAAQKELEDQQKVASDASTAAAAKTAAAAEASSARVAAAQKKLSSIGKWTLFGGAAGIALSVKGAADLSQSMERLQTQAGASTGQVAKLTSGVLSMAGKVGESPNQLAQGMYHVVSSLNATLPAATRASTELNVLRTAAEGAKIGGADLVDVTNAMDAAVVSGIKGVQNYSQAMGALNATVGAGDMTMQQLADAYGKGIAVQAKAAGVSITQLGGALAVLGDNNIRGAYAGTLMTSALRIMKAPSDAAAKALAAVGLSQTKLASDLRSGGIVGALQDLKAHLADSGAAVNGMSAEMNRAGLIITRAFGGRQSTGIQDLLGQLDRLKDKTTQVSAGANQFGSAWQHQQQQFSQQVADLKATIQSLADRFGTTLIPILKSAGTDLGDVITWFDKNRAAAEALGGVIATVLGVAVTVFVGEKVAAFVNGLRGMAGGVQKLIGLIPGLGAAEGESATETETLTAAVRELTGALTGVAPEADAATAEISALGGAATTASGEVAALDTAASGLLGTFGSLGALSVGFGAFEALKNTPGVGNIVDSFTNGGGPKNSFPTPTPGETERKYLAQMAGLPGGYKGPLTAAGVIHARTQDGYPAEKQMINELFKQINAQGHFGHHGFVPAPAGGGAGTALVGHAGGAWGKAVNTSEHLGGSSSVIQWAADAQAAAKKYGVNPALLLGDISQESGGTPVHSTGSTPGIGNLTQFLPSTAKEYGVQFGTTPAAELSQIMGQARYLKALGVNKNATAALEGYNSGQIGNPVSAGYASSVLSMAQEYAPLFTGKTGSIPIASGGAASAGTSIPSPALAAYLGGTTATSGTKATMRYYQHQPVGLMTDAQWQAWQAQNSAAATAAAASSSLIKQYGDVSQSGTAKTLENTLGVSTAGQINPQLLAEIESGKPLTGTLNQATGLSSSWQRIQSDLLFQSTAKTKAQRDRQDTANITDLDKTLGHAKLGGSVSNQRYESTIENLILTGQTKEAEKLVAAHKAAMQALSNTLIAQQDTKDGQELDQQATALRDQTTAIQNAMQDAQTIWQASEQKINDMAAGVLQSMQDTQQTVNDTMAGVAQAIKDASTVSTDQSTAVVDAINDQTQTQVDQIGEKGLYGLNLIAQQDKVAADQVKAYWDQQIASAQKQLDLDQQQADAAENAAQIALDNVTSTEHVAVQEAQTTLDTVEVQNAIKVAAAQAQADAAQTSADVTLIGPAQIAVDLNANASKSTQSLMAAQLTKAQGQGAKDVAGSLKNLANVQSDAQASNEAAQGTFDSVNNTASTAIQNAQNTLADITNYWNNVIAGAGSAVASTSGSASLAEADVNSKTSLESARASTQFAGSGLNVQIYGADLSNPAGMTDAVSWAIRSSGLATV